MEWVRTDIDLGTPGAMIHIPQWMCNDPRMRHFGDLRQMARESPAVLGAALKDMLEELLPQLAGVVITMMRFDFASQTWQLYCVHSALPSHLQGQESSRLMLSWDDLNRAMQIQPVPNFLESIILDQPFQAGDRVSIEFDAQGRPRLVRAPDPDPE
jgi:hypothetical protein